MACADTTLLIDLSGRAGASLRRRAAKKLREIQAQGGVLSTTRFNVAELYVGVHKARDRQAEEQRVQIVLAGFEVIEFGDRAAHQFAQITARLHAQGRPVGDMDVLIAATAMAAGERLITRDGRHFANIPGLVVEEY